MHIIFSLFYLAAGGVIFAIEYAYINKKGADAHHILIFFYITYVIIPSVLIYSILAFDPNTRTGVYFFDKTYDLMTPLDSLILCILNVLLLMGVYGVRVAFDHLASIGRTSGRSICVRTVPLLLWLVMGVLICGGFFWSLGAGFLERYSALILFRALDDSSDRNFFTANAFSVTQSYSWLCATLLFIAIRAKSVKIAVGLFVLTCFFSLLMGSRRGFGFPFLIIYLAFFLHSGRLNLKFIYTFFPIVVFWIAVGKEFTASFAYSDGSLDVVSIYDSKLGGILRAFSDLGISQVESLATFHYFDFEFRLGIDHILSVLRRIPFKEFLGIQDIYPERITRITTELFDSPVAADIPPGLLGASWLDFPFLGALVWGVILSLQAFVVNVFFRRFSKSSESVVLLVLSMVIVSLPINTGSYDFTLSIDIFLLVVMGLTSFRTMRT
jgi:hypothetical protein